MKRTLLALSLAGLIVSGCRHLRETSHHQDCVREANRTVGATPSGSSTFAGVFSWVPVDGATTVDCPGYVPTVFQHDREAYVYVTDGSEQEAKWTGFINGEQGCTIPLRITDGHLELVQQGTRCTTDHFVQVYESFEVKREGPVLIQVRSAGSWYQSNGDHCKFSTGGTLMERSSSWLDSYRKCALDKTDQPSDR